MSLPSVHFNPLDPRGWNQTQRIYDSFTHQEIILTPLTLQAYKAICLWDERPYFSTVDPEHPDQKRIVRPHCYRHIQTNLHVANDEDGLFLSVDPFGSSMTGIGTKDKIIAKGQPLYNSSIRHFVDMAAGRPIHITKDIPPFLNYPIECYINRAPEAFWAKLTPVPNEKYKEISDWDGLPLFTTDREPGKYIRPFTIVDKDGDIPIIEFNDYEGLSIMLLNWEHCDEKMLTIKVTKGPNVVDDYKLEPLFSEKIFPNDSIKAPMNAEEMLEMTGLNKEKLFQ